MKTGADIVTQLQGEHMSLFRDEGRQRGNAISYGQGPGVPEDFPVARGISERAVCDSLTASHRN